MSHRKPTVSRRAFIQNASAATLAVPLAHVAGEIATAAVAVAPATGGAAAGPHQATGTRVGEATETSAIVWTRLTQHATRNNDGVVFKKGEKRTKAEPVSIPTAQIEGACPGQAGRVRLRYGLQEDLRDAVVTDWVDVSDRTDFIHQFALKQLKPGASYHYVSETAETGGSAVRGSFTGRFHTPVPMASPSNLRFCVMTCQGYPDRDHVDGHPIYPSMQALDPRFVVMTGDLVYYDNDAPQANSPALARLHWERMFSLPRLVSMMRSTSSYWLKDDHDTLTNDTSPGSKVGELAFAEGQAIFRQQAPLGEPSYRTFRWGRDLQIWFTDGRDFRSRNKQEDGPDKTIWGAEQKAWFKQTVQESTATWKVLVSPTPLVGPDRLNKNDNHSNAGFAHEGNELRAWLKAHVPDNFFVVCGDRHWQYHSIHPTTGVEEFSVGAASDSHAGGSPGENREYHRFHRVKGGFLAVELKSDASRSEITFQLRDVTGKVVYELKQQKVVPRSK